MISAKEAKEQTNKFFQANTDKELNEIEKQIKQAISYGEFFVYMDTRISNPTKEILEKLGYEVEKYKQNNEFYTIIDWR